MNNIEKSIQRRLKSIEKETKKQIIISLKKQTIDDLDVIARTLSQQSGRSTSRNMIVEDAIEAYIADALEIFAERGIVLERESEEEAFFDTIVLPARPEGFRKVFLDENKWYYARINKERIKNLKYIAIYVGAPISKITHYAEIASDGFKYDEEKKKYIVHFKGEAMELEHPVPLGDISAASTRAPRYTTLQRLLTAEEYGDL